jgi:TolA-binding protein
MTGNWGFAQSRAIARMIAVAGAILPVPAVAQTAADVSDQIRKLQDAIGTFQKEHQAEITTIQKQYHQKQHQAQIQNLQKQLDDLKAAQAAPRAAPPPPSAAPAAQVAATGPAPAPPHTPGAAQPSSGAVQPPATAGQGGPKSSSGRHQRDCHCQQPGSMFWNPQPAASVSRAPTAGMRSF